MRSDRHSADGRTDTYRQKKVFCRGRFARKKMLFYYNIHVKKGVTSLSTLKFFFVLVTSSIPPFWLGAPLPIYFPFGLRSPLVSLNSSVLVTGFSVCFRYLVLVTGFSVSFGFLRFCSGSHPSVLIHSFWLRASILPF